MHKNTAAMAFSTIWKDTKSLKATSEGAGDTIALETKVSQACPKSGLLHFVETNSGCDAEAEILPQALDARKMITYLPGSGIPELATEMEGIAPDSLYFKEIADDYMQSFTITAEMIQFIEKSTHKQSADQLWLALHNGRITSSLFGEIMHR